MSEQDILVHKALASTAKLPLLCTEPVRVICSNIKLKKAFMDTVSRSFRVQWAQQLPIHSVTKMPSLKETDDYLYIQVDKLISDFKNGTSSVYGLQNDLMNLKAGLCPPVVNSKMHAKSFTSRQGDVLPSTVDEAKSIAKKYAQILISHIAKLYASPDDPSVMEIHVVSREENSELSGLAEAHKFPLRVVFNGALTDSVKAQLSKYCRTNYQAVDYSHLLEVFGRFQMESRKSSRKEDDPYASTDGMMYFYGMSGEGKSTLVQHSYPQFETFVENYNNPYLPKLSANLNGNGLATELWFVCMRLEQMNAGGRNCPAILDGHVIDCFCYSEYYDARKYIPMLYELCVGSLETTPHQLSMVLLDSDPKVVRQNILKRGREFEVDTYDEKFIKKMKATFRSYFTGDYMSAATVKVVDPVKKFRPMGKEISNGGAPEYSVELESEMAAKGTPRVVDVTYPGLKLVTNEPDPAYNSSMYSCQTVFLDKVVRDKVMTIVAETKMTNDPPKFKPKAPNFKVVLEDTYKLSYGYANAYLIGEKKLYFPGPPMYHVAGPMSFKGEAEKACDYKQTCTFWNSTKEVVRDGVVYAMSKAERRGFFEGKDRDWLIGYIRSRYPIHYEKTGNRFGFYKEEDHELLKEIKGKLKLSTCMFPADNAVMTTKDLEGTSFEVFGGEDKTYSLDSNPSSHVLAFLTESTSDQLTFGDIMTSSPQLLCQEDLDADKFLATCLTDQQMHCQQQWGCEFLLTKRHMVEYIVTYYNAFIRDSPDLEVAQKRKDAFKLKGKVVANCQNSLKPNWFA